MKTKFITDSMAGLDRRYIEKHGILVLSRTITIGEDVFTEAKMSYPMFYKSISNNHDNMTAKDISEDQFFVTFQKYTMIGHSIVCTLASSKISDAYSNAIKAREKVIALNQSASITIIDSQSTSNQHGHITMVGVEYFEEGAEYEQIVRQMMNSIEKNHLYLCPDSEHYLAKNPSRGLVKTIPIYTVEDGKSVVFKNIPSRASGMDVLVSLLEDDATSSFVRHVTILHIDNEQGAMELKKKVMEKTHVDISIMPTSPLQDCDAGIGSLGLAWNVV